MCKELKNALYTVFYNMQSDVCRETGHEIFILKINSSGNFTLEINMYKIKNLVYY